MSDVATNALSFIRDEVAALSHRVPQDVLIAVYDRVRAYRAALATIQDQCESAMLEWMEENKRGIDLGNGIRYYPGVKKTTKCTNLPAAIEALLGTVDGDFTRFCEHLSSNAIKYGAAKKTLAPEAYAQFFETKEETELKEGVATKVKSLCKADERFSG